MPRRTTSTATEGTGDTDTVGWKNKSSSWTEKTLGGVQWGGQDRGCHRKCTCRNERTWR